MKKFLWVPVALLLLFLGYEAFDAYRQYKKKKEHQAYVATLVDTSSPTVSVLHDVIDVGYRNTKKTLHVYVPPKYAQDSITRYPVIYLMDGESSFNDLQNESPEWQVDEVINAASQDGKQTAIVIGINQSENRNAEYTPYIDKDNPDAHGKQFGKWLTTDLKSWVDSNYRTKTDASSTTIGGISRSGMMAYYLIMAHPDIYGNALIQSPSMWVDYDRLMAMELSPQEMEGKKFFVSVGEKEGGPMNPHAKAVYDKFKSKGLGDDQVKLSIIEGEGHWHPTWRKSFAIGYPWIME